MDSATGQTFAGDLNSRSVDLNLVAGERVHCTFTNERDVAPTSLKFFFPIMYWLEDQALSFYLPYVNR